MAVDDGQAVCIIHRKRCDGAFRPGKLQIAGDGSRIRTQVFIAEPDKLRTSGASRCRQQEGQLFIKLYLPAALRTRPAAQADIAPFVPDGRHAGEIIRIGAIYFFRQRQVFGPVFFHQLTEHLPPGLVVHDLAVQKQGHNAVSQGRKAGKN